MDITWVHLKKNVIHGLEEVPHANFVQTKVHGDICKKYDSIMCSENMWKHVKTWKQLFSQIPSEVTFVMLTKKKLSGNAVQRDQQKLRLL